MRWQSSYVAVDRHIIQDEPYRPGEFAFKNPRVVLKVFISSPLLILLRSMANAQGLLYSLHDNRYSSNRRPGTIRRSVSFGRFPGNPVLPYPYPSPGDMVGWAESPDETRLASTDAYHHASFDDRLWMLSCRGVRAQELRAGRGGYGDTSVLNSLFQMGQWDWPEAQKPSPPVVRSIRFSAALGQELLRRIELSEDRVCCFWLINP